MTARLKCPICRSENAALFLAGHPGYQEPQTFDIWRCPDCNTSFVNAEGVETGPIYDSIYRNSRFVPGYSRYYEYSQKVLKAASPLEFLADSETVYWAIKQRLEFSDSPKDAPVLEVGSGLGYLTYALNQSGRNVVGLDISETAVQNARKSYGDHFVRAEIGDYSRTNAGRFAFVVATEVIEHIGDVYPFLESGLRLLRPGGELLVTTPNRDASSQNVVWDIEAPPVHLWWFSSQSFAAIAARLSCSLSFVDMSGYHDAPKWRYADHSPSVTKLPTLNREGDLLPQFRPRPFPLRVASKLKRMGLGLFKTKPQHNPSDGNRSKPAPAPTLCAILKKRPQ
jgi:SAM-dependent methyltransferase